MSYLYSDPTQESDPHRLPDCEVFHSDPMVEAFKVPVARTTCDDCGSHITEAIDGIGEDRILCEPCAREAKPAGWYIGWLDGGLDCFASIDGPYATEQAAIDAAREQTAEQNAY